MRHVITVQALTETPNTVGQLVKSWNTVGTFRANVMSPAGRELLNAKQVRASVTDVVEMRNVSRSLAILPSMQLLFGSRILRIVSVVDPENRGRRLLLHCEEIVLPTTS